MKLRIGFLIMAMSLLLLVALPAMAQDATPITPVLGATIVSTEVPPTMPPVDWATATFSGIATIEPTRTRITLIPMATNSSGGVINPDGGQGIPPSLVKQMLADVSGQVGIVAIVAMLLFVIIVVGAIVPIVRWLYKSTPPIAQPIIREGVTAGGQLITNLGSKFTDSMLKNEVAWDDALANIINQQIAAKVKELLTAATPEQPTTPDAK